MRFLIKRPRIQDVKTELKTVMEVMVSDLFIVLDLLLFCLIFTVLLFPVLQSLLLSFLFFSGTYVFFLICYFFVFNRFFRK